MLAGRACWLGRNSKNSNCHNAGGQTSSHTAITSTTSCAWGCQQLGDACPGSKWRRSHHTTLMTGPMPRVWLLLAAHISACLNMPPPLRFCHCRVVQRRGVQPAATLRWAACSEAHGPQRGKRKRCGCTTLVWNCALPGRHLALPLIQGGSSASAAGGPCQGNWAPATWRLPAAPSLPAGLAQLSNEPLCRH